MKVFLKKWVSSTLKNLGYVSVIVTALSVLPAIPNGSPDHADHYLTYLFLIFRVMAAIIPIITFIEQFIMDYQLFSKKIWTRRIVSLVICLSVTVCTFNMFGFKLKAPKAVNALSLILISAVSAVIAYIIEDKNKKKDILEINQKLSELNKQ
jgi:hypothetical protein